MGNCVILEKETNKGMGQQTLIAFKDTGKMYIVSSVSDIMVNETYIFKADSDGDVSNWGEVYGTRPADHDYVINELINGMLTEEDFYGV